MHPTALLFDMDGLMFDTERLVLAAWRQAVVEAGYPARDEVFLECVGRNAEATDQVVRAAYGPDFPLETVNRRTNQVIWQRINREGVPLKPGLLPLLDYLEAQGVPRAVASSTERPIVERLLAQTGLRSRFAAVVGGDEVPRSKPAPDIFLLAAQRLGVEPARCLVLEDSEPGARAGLAAGMAVVVVPDLKPPSAEVVRQVVAVLPSLEAVLVWLAQDGHD
ncbi:MAG: HAD family phosphatase [Caldilineales bacterium]|nr:HAD family phosphatase [Caldilineales bacterium]MDW8319396.1 HAD family phosphatase [Anaerolineae bacterium]